MRKSKGIDSWAAIQVQGAPDAIGTTVRNAFIASWASDWAATVKGTTARIAFIASWAASDRWADASHDGRPD